MEEKPAQNSAGAPPFNNSEEKDPPVVATPSSAASARSTLSKGGYALPEPSPQEVMMMGATVGASAAATGGPGPAAPNKQQQQQQQLEEEHENLLSAKQSNDPPLKRQKVSSAADHRDSFNRKISQNTAADAAAETPRPAVVSTTTTVTSAASTTYFAAAAAAASAGSETPPVKTPDTAMESYTSSREAEVGLMGNDEEEYDDDQGDDDHEVVASIRAQQQQQQHEDEQYQEYHDNKKPRHHMSRVQRSTSAGSVASDLSSSSASTLANNHSSSGSHDEQREELSPVPTTYVASEIPPAPPSTPASSAGSAFTWDSGAAAAAGGSILMGCATPLPIRASVQNASLLEQEQQRMLLMEEEGAATPMTARPEAYSYQDLSSQPTPSGGKTPSTSASTTGRRKSHGMPTLPEDFSDWAVGDRYEMVRILGRGSYGEVAQAIDLSKQPPSSAVAALGVNTTTTQQHQPSFVAIKRIQSPFDQELDAIRLYREVHILRHMRGHDCIIQLLDVVQPPTDDLDDFHDLYLVFEYVDTDLYKLIMSPQYLTTEHIQTFLYQMLAGLKYIHSFSVIHRDLKPANILLNEDCSLKICDFGLARIVDSTTMSAQQEEEVGLLRRPTTFAAPPLGLTRQLTRHVVTRWYRAPELILIQPYTSAVDIWSLGCILAELLSMQEGNVACYQDRKPLFPGGTCFPLSGDREMKKDDKLDQLSVIFGIIGTPSPQDVAAIGKANEYIASLGKMEGKPLESIFPAADPAAIDLLRQMLLFNPKRRCTAAQALEHEFFKTVRRHELEKTAAPGPLTGPDFLETNSVDLKVLKQKTYEEVLWYRDHGGGGTIAESSSPAAAHDSKPAATNAAT